VDSVNTLLCNNSKVHEALEEVAEQSSGTAASDASSFARHLESFQFIVCAVVAQYLLGFIRPLSVSLQSKSCDLLTAFEDANQRVAVISSQRTEEIFSKLFVKVKKIANDVGVVPSKPRTGASKRQTRRDNPDVLEIEGYYRVTCYFAFLDHIVQHLKSRFSDDIKGVLLACYILPSRIKDLTPDVLEMMKTEFSEDLPSSENLEQEFLRWSSRIKQEPNIAELRTLNDVAEVFNSTTSVLS